ncbi:unnamed protein product [Caenorhabditis angaria]|uniref:Checkpoint protein n=1 Tax=Caenorhabditis angaria TaxID=860376 RepID=A0A9P1I3T7_9PELO|nr:unnamed protein product [Caenorhabditis angaria]
MKFTAVLQDSNAIESFIRIVNATCRLGKKRCCMKMQKDGLSFISCASLQDGGTWFSIFIPCNSQLFRRFEVVGLNPRSPDQNFIYLEIDMDNLVNIIPGGHCYMKIKLSKNTADEPVLILEVRNPDSDVVIHQVPINVILSRYWSNYARPTVGHKKMSIFLPQPRNLSKVVIGLKNMNAKIIKFTASSEGEMRLSSSVEHGEIDALFTDLPTNIAESDSQEETASVQIVIKSISTMFQSFAFLRSPVKMNIISHRMAEFSINSDDCTVSYIVGNISE